MKLNSDILEIVFPYKSKAYGYIKYDLFEIDSLHLFSTAGARPINFLKIIL